MRKNEDQATSLVEPAKKSRCEGHAVVEAVQVYGGCRSAEAQKRKSKAEKHGDG